MPRSVNKLALLIAVLLSVLFYNRCKKPTVVTFKISGIVQNEQSGDLLSDVEVSLKTRSLNSGTFNNNFQTVDTDLTDGSGAFEFELENSSLASIQLTFEKDDFFLKEIEISPEDIDVETGRNFNVLMNSVAVINLNLVNQNPFDDNDAINFRYTNANFSCSCCDNSTNTYTGSEVDTTLTCFTPGEVSLSYLAFIVKGGSTSIDSGTFVISTGENNLEILY